MKKPSTRKRRSQAETILGVAWYRDIDWPRVKASFSDAVELHDTYAEWLRSAESVLEHLGQTGVAVRPYTIDIDHFLGWCSAQDLSTDGEARAAYIAEMLKGPDRAKK